MGLLYCVYPKVSKVGFELDQVKRDMRNQSGHGKDDDYRERSFWNVNSLAAFEAAHNYQTSGSTGAL